MCFITMFLTLFLIIDSVGNVSSFVDILKNENKRYSWIVTRELLIALVLMLFFNFVGSQLLDILDITPISVYFASGIVLFLFALSVIYPSEKSPRISSKRHQDPFIIPLAVPLVAGPALLATIILFSQINTDVLCRIESILFAWTLSYLVLLGGRQLYSLLGKNGLLALERLFALILVIMATQRIVQGIKLFALTYIT